MKLYNYKDVLVANELFEGPNGLSGSFDRKHYSASFLKSWKQCPAKLIIDNVSDSDPTFFKVGSVVHKVLELSCDEGFTHEAIEAAKPEAFKNLNEEEVKKASDYLSSYEKINPYEGKDEDTLSLPEHLIETYVEPLGIALPVKLKGVIDRIDYNANGISIIDYKTASKPIYPGAYASQMAIYKWLFEESAGIEVDSIYIAQIMKDSSEYIKQKIDLKSQSQLIDDIFAIDQEVVESMEEREYKKRKGSHCRWCPLNGQCDETMRIDVK